MLLPLPYQKIYDWFREEQRNLPWRKNRTPYRVWIAEVMLQQTRSEVVKDYYIQWTKEFPTLKALATYTPNQKEYRQEKVLSLWQGLGYYSRALNIIKTADIIYNDYQGRFPHKLKQLLTLPGIGPYTAGAILNFGIKNSPPTPMVDGNFERVFSRIYYLNQVTKKDKINNNNNLKKQVWNIADILVNDPSNIYPNIFNEAIMEIGATVCFRTNPLCEKCPFSLFSEEHFYKHPICKAYQNKKTNHSPFSKSKKTIIAHSTIYVIKHQNYFLIMKSSTKKTNSHSSNILKDLWRFPTIDRHSQITKFNSTLNHKTKSAKPMITISQLEVYKKLLLDHLSINASDLQPLLQFSHYYTKYKIHLTILKATLNTLTNFDNKSLNIEWRWVSTEELKKIGMSSADQKIRTLLC